MEAVKNTPKGARQPPDTLSFMVRLWRVSGGSSTDGDEKVIWRASIQEALTSERMFFASLNELFGFLQQQTDAMFALAADDCDGTMAAHNSSIPHD